MLHTGTTGLGVPFVLLVVAPSFKVVPTWHNMNPTLRLSYCQPEWYRPPDSKTDLPLKAQIFMEKRKIDFSAGVAGGGQLQF